MTILSALRFLLVILPVTATCVHAAPKAPLVLEPTGRESQSWNEFLKFRDSHAEIKLPGEMKLTLGPSDHLSDWPLATLELRNNSTVVIRTHEGAKDKIVGRYDLDLAESKKEFLRKLGELKQEGGALQITIIGKPIRVKPEGAVIEAYEGFEPTVAEMVSVMKLVVVSGFSAVFVDP